MATTTDMAPTRSASSPRPRRASSNGTRSRSRAAAADPDLSDQIAQLQRDLKAIAGSVSNLAESTVGEARGLAEREAKHWVRQGQGAMNEITDEFGHMEKQIKDTIRQKPLTAVAGAIAIGFVLALLTR